MKLGLHRDTSRGRPGVPGGSSPAIPKPEARNPKAARSPKPGITSLLAGIGVDSPAGQVTVSPSPRRQPAKGRFGFRSSAFLRPSVFGLRISGSAQAAFSLLEVMIACGIFFMAVFSILAMVSSVLRNARSLRRTELDAGMVAAQITRTNKLYEGTESGDFGNLYPDYSWETDTYEVQTNGLYQVDIVVRRRGLQQPVDIMSILVYAPESQAGFGRPTIR